ncbi:MAG: hypothetical protein QOJ03_584 [Frankiaceae bacterium]|nr:hypothetical protein [Frankiaceae bacterium]
MLGGSVAGLSTALALARVGHRVTVVERDDLRVGDVGSMFSLPRKGVPHFLLPHMFIPRGRKELRTHFPDVYASLLDAGAVDVDVGRKVPGDALPADDDLCYTAARRPLIEWALRRAVLAEPGIDVRGGVHVRGVRVTDGRITAVEVDGGSVDVELVVDAMGRRSPMRDWLIAAGRTPNAVAGSDCGVVYYSRYYRLRPDFELPPGPWLLSPRGDCGYLGFATFPGDDRTFGTVLAVPSGVAEWRALKDAPTFEAATAQIPMLRLWVDPDGVRPITDVLPMAGLRNSFADYDPSSAVGVVPVGDAYCHTDPVLAHGLAFGLVHAVALAKVLDLHADAVDAFRAYAEEVAPALRERYALATALDEQRRRMWLGEPVDFSRRDGDYALFSMTAAAAAATVDPEVFRVFVRRLGLLDSTAVLDDDRPLQTRIEQIFDELRSVPRPPLGPSREEMLAAMGQ